MSEPITLYRGEAVKTVYAPSQAAIMQQHGWSRTPPAKPARGPSGRVEASADDDEADEANGVAVAGAVDDDADEAPAGKAEQAAPAKRKGKA